ncbi:MAG: PAS domain S-box protein [Pseudomonadota bacterium]
MTFLDVRTVVFINVITGCLCTVVIVFLWFQNRKRYAGTLFWVADFGFQTAAMVLIILRGSIPDTMSMVLSNSMAVAGAILGYMGLERFLEKKSSQVHNCILLALFVWVHTYYALIHPDLTLRNINVSLALFIISAQCAWLMLFRVPPGMRTMARGTGLVFMGICGVSIIRMAILISSPKSDNDFFHVDSVQMVLIIAYQMLLIGLSYSLTLMVNRRLLTEIHTQEEKFSKAFHSAPQAITLTRLSDGSIREVNHAFLAITGYAYGEIVKETTVGLNLWADNADRTAVVAELSRDKRVRETEYRFRKKTGEIIIGLFSAEIIMINNSPWVLSVIIDITDRKRAEAEREKLLAEREQALSQIKTLSGLLPICAHCKKVRDDTGYWNQIEAYIEEHSDAEFSHSICRECAKKYYPDSDIYDDNP